MSLIASALRLLVYLVLGAFLLAGGVLVTAFIVLGILAHCVDRACTILLDLFTVDRDERDRT